MLVGSCTACGALGSSSSSCEPYPLSCLRTPPVLGAEVEFEFERLKSGFRMLAKVDDIERDRLGREGEDLDFAAVYLRLEWQTSRPEERE